MKTVALDDKRLVALEGLNKLYTTNGSNVFDVEHVNLTDSGYASVFSIFICRQALYCHPFKKWLIWDGRRWKIDEKKAIYLLAKGVNRMLIDHANRTQNEELRKARLRFLLKCEDSTRIKAMLDLAGAHLAVLPEQLDCNPWLLNLENGVLNLHTMELQKHDPSLLMTKLSPVSYDPEAQSPTWFRFLDEITRGDQELILFIQKAIGLSLLGEQIEHAVFILYGRGANGKSTLLNAIRTLFGDYAIETPTETLMSKKGDYIPNDVARLKGARFVSAIEGQEGRRLNEPLIKQLTGNDTVVARFLHAEWFEFEPQFTLFMATNHKPVIRGSDNAIWRRIRLIPFQVTIPEEKQDKRLQEKLKEELPGILLWALGGLMAWQREGLGNPEEVSKATQQYRDEMDLLAEFIEEKCELKKSASIMNKWLYEAYHGWCENTGERPVSMKMFAMKLAEKGFDSFKTVEGKKWFGLGLKV